MTATQFAGLDPVGVARELRGLHRLNPPLDPNGFDRLTDALHLRVQSDDRLPVAGQFVPLGIGGEIRLQGSGATARQRFTLAHEIGHAVLNSRGVVDPVRPDPAEEDWCDRFAGELLLPGWWVSRMTAGRPPGINLLAVVAERAQVSLASALVALHTSAEWDHCLVAFRFSEGQWRIWSSTFVPREIMHIMTAGENASDAVAAATDFGRLCIVPILINGVEVNLRTEVMGNQTTRWMLVEGWELIKAYRRRAAARVT